MLNKKFFIDITLLAVSQIALYYSVKYIINSLDPQRDKKQNAKEKSIQNLQRLHNSGWQLNEHEQIIAGEIVFSDDIDVGFDDIGGMETMLENLKESVLYPLLYPEMFQSVSGLLAPPKGVLLYGPPGCGKTMTAKALAKESGATFFNVHVSTMTDKWFGESQKLVHALFSLAKKLEPSIIFIDEIDCFLRDRKSSDHEATAMMKAEFMTLWDGMNTGTSRVIVLGATNRPNDLDKAILRRMPKRFAVNVPNEHEREKVLLLLLKRIVLEPNFDWKQLAKMTDGYSNSDLKELCRNAVMVPVRESIRNVSRLNMDKNEIKIRPITLNDFKEFVDVLYSTTEALVPIVEPLD